MCPSFLPFVLIQALPFPSIRKEKGNGIIDLLGSRHTDRLGKPSIPVLNDGYHYMPPSHNSDSLLKLGQGPSPKAISNPTRKPLFASNSPRRLHPFTPPYSLRPLAFISPGFANSERPTAARQIRSSFIMSLCTLILGAIAETAALFSAPQLLESVLTHLCERPLSSLTLTPF